MKGRIIFEDWDCSNNYDCSEEVSPWGRAVITKATKYGTFTAETHVEKSDIDIMNKWDGFLLAEYKCDLKAQKAKLKKMKAQLDGMIIAYNNVLQIPNLDEYTLKKFSDQIAWTARDVRILERTIKSAEKNYPQMCEKILKQRRDLRKRFPKETESYEETS